MKMFLDVGTVSPEAAEPYVDNNLAPRNKIASLVEVKVFRPVVPLMTLVLPKEKITKFPADCPACGESKFVES